jgi:hypothetical protein
MENASIVLALLTIIGCLLSIDTLGVGMSQNLTHNLTKTNSNLSNATANNPFLSGGTPFGSAALPP